MKKGLIRILSALALVAIFIVGVAAYAYFIEPRLLVAHKTALNVPNFDSRLNGLKIVAISDIHGGSNGVTEDQLRKIVNLANDQSPDLIVLLGDYVSETKFKGKDLRMPVETIAANMRGLQAKFGVYGVIGNHDWWWGEKRVRTEFEKAGVKFLENETEPIEINGTTLTLWGIEDYWKNLSVPTENSYDKIPRKENIIALTHNPDSLLKAPDGISVMLAGHSHGGQVNFPFFGARAWVNDPRFMAGEAVVDGKRVFVTTGIGCTGPQIRMRVPPEIAVITLNAAN